MQMSTIQINYPSCINVNHKFSKHILYKSIFKCVFKKKVAFGKDWGASLHREKGFRDNKQIEHKTDSYCNQIPMYSWCCLCIFTDRLCEMDITDMVSFGMHRCIFYTTEL